jgi:uncharacterized protein (TIGR02996 family)
VTATDPAYLALVAGIRGEPECDVRRLATADWLEEHGEPERAAWIRARVADPSRWEGFVCGHDPLGWFPATRALGDKCFVDTNRGFVARVSGPLAAFGEERGCTRCLVPWPSGTPGLWHRPPTADPCPHCHNTGRVWVPAPAFAELCRREPLPDDGVTVTDRDAGETHPPPFTRGRGLWVRHGPGVDDGGRLQDTLPGSLYDLLPKESGHDGRWAAVYHTPAAATVALSAALVRAARG